MKKLEHHQRHTVSDSTRGSIVVGLSVIALFFGGFGAWAGLAPLSGATVGTGVVAVKGNRQTVQHQDGGTIREIAVRDGDRVKRGSVVLRLDDIAARSRVQTLTATRDASLALQARLIAERNGDEEPVFPPELVNRLEEAGVSEAVAAQRALFKERKAQVAAETAVRRQKIAQLREQIGGLRMEIEGLTRQMALIAEELEGVRELYTKGYAPKPRLLALQRTQAQLLAERGAKTAAVAQAEQAVGETELAIVAAQSQRSTEVSEGLREVQAKLTEGDPTLIAAREVLDRTVLRAPATGEVVGLTVFTPGGVLAAGATVLDIVPTEEGLIVETKVAPENIDEVAVGSVAEVRFIGLPQRSKPEVKGRVVTLSADRLTDERSGAGYFFARVQLDPADLASSSIEPHPGMPVQVLITTEPRTLLAYIVGPLGDAVARAFREE
jgi:HlyD family type I secretion membrane fusion protein